MKISVIVPVYNTPINILKKCIQSILNQTYKDIELIIVDDCSSNNSCFDICKEYMEIDKRVIALKNNKNSGPGMARNIGLEKATGDYISFVDSDDWLELNSYECQINYLQSKNLDTVIFDYKRYYGDEKIRVKRNIEENFEYKRLDQALIRYLCFSSELNGPCYILYCKDIIDRYKLRFPIDMKLGEDFMFNSKYFLYSEHGGHLNKELYNYRFDNNSLTNRFSLSKFLEIKIIYKERLNIITNYLGIDKNIAMLNQIYLREIFRLVCQGLDSGADDRIIYAQLLDETISTIISSKQTTIGNLTIKYLLEKRYFKLISLLYKIKQYINNKY